MLYLDINSENNSIKDILWGKKGLLRGENFLNIYVLYRNKKYNIVENKEKQFYKLNCFF